MGSAKDMDIHQHGQVSCGPRISASFSSERTTVSPPAERPADGGGCKSSRTGYRSWKGKAQTRSGLRSQGHCGLKQSRNNSYLNAPLVVKMVIKIDLYFIKL